ncbi:MAG: hypothetical protein ACQETI_07075 [Halobacteriota archaeon]
MEELSLGVPRSILESLPQGDEGPGHDMQQSVAALEVRLNRVIAEADEEATAAAAVVDEIERLASRLERYDEFVPELRAWGQSPVYAIGWRDLQADLIMQIREHEWLSAHVDAECSHRLAVDESRFDAR